MTAEFTGRRFCQNIQTVYGPLGREMVYSPSLTPPAQAADITGLLSFNMCTLGFFPRGSVPRELSRSNLSIGLSDWYFFHRTLPFEIFPFDMFPLEFFNIGILPLEVFLWKLPFGIFPLRPRIPSGPVLLPYWTWGIGESPCLLIEKFGECSHGTIPTGEFQRETSNLPQN